MILTLDDLRTKYGFSFPASQDAAYQALLDTAEEACLSYASIEQGTAIEYFSGGAQSYVLTHSPVLSITSVMVDGSPAQYRYEARPETVFLDSAAGSEVVIAYECGWPKGSVPAAIRTAVAFTVQHLLKLNSAKLIGINSRNTDGGTETIEQSTPPLAVQKLLEPYRRNRAL